MTGRRRGQLRRAAQAALEQATVGLGRARGERQVAQEHLAAARDASEIAVATRLGELRRPTAAVDRDLARVSRLSAARVERLRLRAGKAEEDAADRGRAAADARQRVRTRLVRRRIVERWLSSRDRDAGPRPRG